ncbi:MAG TPA: Ku protein [Bryobacteraceae bacterium]|jgi:DNA end-binding protein Ku|nr:Ku protein [Bryobacteraceae bacterium]
MPSTVWKGSVSFGLVSFPVGLSAAARPDTVHFHLLHKKDNSRLKEVWYCAEEDKPVESNEIVKGYEYNKGHYAVVDPAELKKVTPPTASVMEILQFVKTDEVDPIFFEKSWYVIPQPQGEKPYRLLRQAMEETGYRAIAKLTMHGREHIVIIRPSDDGLVLHTLYFVNELNKSNKTKPAGSGAFTKKEVELAKRLIDALAGPFKPEQYKDEYRQNVEKLIEQKRKGQKITAVAQPKAAPVVDIMEALQRSLAKKPAARKKAKRAA